MGHAGPPRLARALLSMVLPRATAEFVLGDLEEMYRRRSAARGRRRADLWYWRTTLYAVTRRPRGAPAPDPLRRDARRGGISWGGLLLDARAAARSLRRTPGFVLVTSGTLALGLGATIAVYAIADQLMLRPPPGVHGTRGAVYVEFGPANDPSDRNYLSPVDMQDFRAAAGEVVGQLTAMTAGPVHVGADAADPASATVAFVDGPLFELLGVRAELGRLPTGHELAQDAPWDVAILSERLWTTLFARDPAVVGRTVRVNGQPATVVGVVGDGFKGLDRGEPVDVWLPASALIPVHDFDPERLASREAALYPRLIGRIPEGSTPQAVAMRLRVIAERLEASLPEGRNTVTGNVPRVHEGVHIVPDARGPTRDALRILWAVVALVLVVACANVANLLLFRALRGRHEISLRRALGASRTRIVAQQMIGNGLLASGALAAGLGVALAITRLFAGRSLLGVPAFEALAVDGRLLLFASAAALTTAVLSGTLPAWVAARGGTTSSAARFEGARAPGRHERLRRAMTVVQLTASLALIVGALLLARTVRALYAIDPGYRTGDVFVVPLDYPDPDDTRGRLAAFEQARAAAAGVPGVERVALDVGGPLVSRLRGPVTRSEGADAGRTFGIVTYVTPGWFELMDVRIVRGRAFGSEDRGPAGLNRVILSDGLARTLFGDEDPVGRTIRAFGRRHDVEVIGVAEDIRYSRILSDPEPTVYHPWAEPLLLGETVVLYRAPGGGAALTGAVREAITRADPRLAVELPVPLTTRLDEQLADHRLFAQLLGLLSTLAAVLASVGFYGVVAYGVADRTREFGIRMALGAPARGIARLVLRQTVLTLLIGAVLGLAAAALLARGLADRLHGVGVLDPFTYGVAVLALVALGAAACVGPTRSATRVDPMTVLREE